MGGPTLILQLPGMTSVTFHPDLMSLFQEDQDTHALKPEDTIRKQHTAEQSDPVPSDLPGKARAVHPI